MLSFTSNSPPLMTTAPEDQPILRDPVAIGRLDGHEAFLGRKSIAPTPRSGFSELLDFEPPSACDSFT